MTRPLLLMFIALTCSMAARDPFKDIQKDKAVIASQMERVLDQELESWYPLCLDSVDGGYFSDIDYAWNIDGPQNKMIVTQARHVWSASHALLAKPEDTVLLRAAEHGFRFLRHTMWDSTYGGFYDLVDRRGRPLNDGGQIIKRAYGGAFAIYALAAYYKATGDTAALAFAQQGYAWLEKHSHDVEHGGYFQFMTRDGTPLTGGYQGVPPKDQNSTIHLLEAYTELYSAWPDRGLEQRLGSLLALVRDRITTDKGYMRLFFRPECDPRIAGRSVVCRGKRARRS